MRIPGRPSISRAATALSIVAVAFPALAQDAGDDWDLGRDPARDAVIAAVTFDNFGIAVRCVDRRLSVLMSGMPPGRGERNLKMALGESGEADQTWISAGDGTTVFSLWPTSVANYLRQGGRLQVIAPQDDGPARRYVVDLPRSDAAVPAVLTACGETIPSEGQANGVASREDLTGLTWARRIEARFPFQNNGPTPEFGIVALSCVTDRGGYLKRCRIESEYPADGVFGRAAQLGAHQSGRVAVTEGDPAAVEGRRVVFVVRFGMVTDFNSDTPSRLRDRSRDGDEIAPR